MAALVESWLAAARRVAEAEALLAGATHGLDRDMVVLEQTATEQRARLGETRRRIAELEDALLDADRQLDATCAQTGFARSELAALAVALGGQRQDREYQNALHSALADDRRTEQLTTQLGALDAAVLRTRAIADERRQLAAEHAASRPEELGDADALDALAAAVTEAERRAAETAAALAADTDARRRREAAFGALAEDERKAEIDRVLGEVIGSHDGKLFRSFAQSLTLDGLLAITNAHLDELAPRFQLERIPRHDLEIQVIDRDLGDDVRSVQSLSGGEAFLVSLALALGLSSMSAHDVRVRTLLIDEGFGTLDPTTLDGALAVLDRLQATGRQIGVISHVPALIERVGAHVRVVQRGVGASQVVIS